MNWEEKVEAVRTALDRIEEEHGVRLTGWDDGSLTIWSEDPRVAGNADYWTGKGVPHE